MSFFKRLLVLLGFKAKKTVEEQFTEEFENLKTLQVKSLQFGASLEELTPALVLGHIERMKTLIIELQQKGSLRADESTILYVLGNISREEDTINSFGVGLGLDPDIYLSQVGASIGDIIKDLVILMK